MQDAVLVTSCEHSAGDAVVGHAPRQGPGAFTCSVVLASTLVRYFTRTCVLPVMQVWVKTPQMLVRDRLLSAHSVRPALQRLTLSLYSLAGTYLGCSEIFALCGTVDACDEYTCAV